MAVLKFILVILLCIPLVYFIWKMFTSLVDDLDQQNKYHEKLRRKNETGQKAERGERVRKAEKRPGFAEKFKGSSSVPERPRDRETMRTERMRRRNTYSGLDTDYAERYDRRPEPPEPPRYRPTHDYDRQAEERDRGFRW